MSDKKIHDVKDQEDPENLHHDHDIFRNKNEYNQS